MNLLKHTKAMVGKLKGKNKFFLTMLLLVFCQVSFGQTVDHISAMEENYIQIRQKPGTNSLLRNYLSAVNSIEDTLYAVLYMPRQCPRCEVLISSFYRHLKEENQKLLLITTYQDSVSAAKYNKEKNHQADYFLYDTENRYRDVFSVNIGHLGGPQILKLCKSEGRMITGGDCVMMNTDFVSQLIAHNELLDFHDYQTPGVSTETAYAAIVPEAKFIKENYVDHQFELPENIHISSVYQVMRFEEDMFYYNDFLKNGVFCFTQCNETGNMVFDVLIQSDSLENRTFIALPEAIYQDKLKNGEVYHICLNPNQLDKDRIGVAYSLPNLFVMDSTNGLHIAYYNAPAIVVRNTTTGEKAPLIELDFNIFDEEELFFYAPFNFSSDNKKIIMSCSKLTWPTEYDKEDYMDIVELNPFDEGFYQTENPIMAAFDINTGKLISRFGSLQACHEKSRTGYNYINPVSCHYKDEILFTDAYSGQLFTVKSDNLNEITNHYSLFEVDTENFPPIDSLNFYTYEYVNPYNGFFHRVIEDIKLTEDHVFCLVRYGMPATIAMEPYKDEYVFAQISRKNKEVKEYRLPRYPDLDVLGYGLKNENNRNVVPFIFLKKEGHAFLRVFQSQ